MEKVILCSASKYTQKYFINSEFDEIPEDIINDIKELCIITSAKIKAVFSIGFYEDGNVFLEVQNEDNVDFDEENAKTEISIIQNEQKELIKALQLWYTIFKTEEGKVIKNKILQINKYKR